MGPKRFFAMHRSFPNDADQDLQWPPVLAYPKQVVVDNGDTVEIPPYIENVVTAPEPVVVMGGSLWQASEAEAEAAIEGFTVASDVESLGDFPLRGDLQSDGERGVTALAAHTILPTFFPMRHEYQSMSVEEFSNLDIEGLIDGELFTKTSTSKMQWTVPEMLSFMSKIIKIEEGDWIGLGNPSSVIESKSNVIDNANEISAHIEGLGTVTNPVVRRTD